MFSAKDTLLSSLEARMGLAQPKTSAEVFERSNFPEGPVGDDAFCEACARRDLALEKNPRLNDLKRKYQIQLEAQRASERKAEQARLYAQTRANTFLNKKEQQDLASQALELANTDLRTGRITAAEFDDARSRHFEKLEHKALDTKAAGTVFNEWARAEIARNRLT